MVSSSSSSYSSSSSPSFVRSGVFETCEPEGIPPASFILVSHCCSSNSDPTRDLAEEDKVPEEADEVDGVTTTYPDRL